MKTILLACTIIIAFACPAHLKSQSNDASPAFKGVPFGIGCASFLQRYKPSGEWMERGGKPEIWVDDATYSLILTPPTKMMQDPASGKVWFETLQDTVAGARADIKFYFTIQSKTDYISLKKQVDRWVAEKTQLSEIKAEFSPNDVDSVFDALKQKYGEPKETTKKLVSARQASSVDVTVYEWTAPGLIATFSRIAPPKGRPLFTLRSTVVKSVSAVAGASDL